MTWKLERCILKPNRNPAGGRLYEAVFTSDGPAQSPEQSGEQCQVQFWAHERGKALALILASCNEDGRHPSYFAQRILN